MLYFPIEIQSGASLAKYCNDNSCANEGQMIVVADNKLNTKCGAPYVSFKCTKGSTSVLGSLPAREVN